MPVWSQVNAWLVILEPETAVLADVPGRVFQLADDWSKYCQV